MKIKFSSPVKGVYTSCLIVYIQSVKQNPCKKLLMRKTLDEVKAQAKRRTILYKELADAMNMSEITKSLSRTKGRGKIGSSLIKAGIALIAVPDPITDVPGIIMVAGGYIISRFWEESGITDIRRELRRTIESIQEAKARASL